MRFAHIADCHIGSWRDPRLNSVSFDVFSKAIDISLEKQVDFILIAGDLFNTPLPSIDKLKQTVQKLKEVKDKGVPVYGIPGSHDFSPSGKTMIDVLENAGLFTNVCKGVDSKGKLKLLFTTDQKTGVKLTGIIGRRGMLDRKLYEELDLRSLEEEPGKKIFLFHTLITELKPKDLEKMDSQEISLLPKGFDYYAGGHPHIVKRQDLPGYNNICYPGPLFPNNFDELEKLGHGGFYIVDDMKPVHHVVKLFDIEKIDVDATHKTPQEVEQILEKKIDKTEFKDKIVLLRVKGTLESGKKSDIDFNSIIRKLQEAYFVMKNTNQLHTKDFEEIKVSAKTSIEIEDDLISQAKKEYNNQEKLTRDLMHVLQTQRQDGEKVFDFESRVKKDIEKIMESLIEEKL
jgi:exonuclease SbcD